MASGADAPAAPRRLNHVEFAHRPGEGELAIALFEALGCTWYSVDVPPYGAYVVVRLDDTPHGENDMFASQAEPAQLALEAALQARIAADEPFAAAAADYRRLQRDLPFRATHIGLRLPNTRDFDTAVARLSELARGAFAARLSVGSVTERSLEESRASWSPLKQLWLWTDVISTGLLTFGQQIELQTYEP